jgi:hypothetical protein
VGVDVEALPCQEKHGFVQGQSDDICIGTDKLLDEATGKALNCIGTRLAAPLAGGKVPFYVSA